ncbi:hypothetical protein C8A03DRAFT_15197, partial [Achaetomium macrosporum]
DEGKLMRLKLGLLHEEDLANAHADHQDRVQIVQDILRKMRSFSPPGAVEATARFLDHLWDAVRPRIEQWWAGSSLRPEDVEIRFVFAVPVVWDFATVARMKKAVVKSKIGRFGQRPLDIQYVAEPEAAALATFPSIAQDHSLEIGQTVVICDCGGGTVDVISYEITNLSLVVVKESVAGEGRLLGDIFMRTGLQALVQRKIDAVTSSGTIDEDALDQEVERVWVMLQSATRQALHQPGRSLTLHVDYLNDGRRCRRHQVELHGYAPILPNTDP